MQPRPKSSRYIRKLSFCTGRSSVRSQLFPGVLISCVSKLLCLIKDVTMTFPHIHKLRLCINILLFALTCEWFSSKLKMKSPAWVRHHSFKLIGDLSIPSASNGFWGFPKQTLSFLPRWGSLQSSSQLSMPPLPHPQIPDTAKQGTPGLEWTPQWEYPLKSRPYKTRQNQKKDSVKVKRKCASFMGPDYT